MAEELRTKVDALSVAVNDLTTKYALTSQHVLNHENLVKDFMLRNDQRMEILDSKMDTGFDELRKSNAVQTAILTKWGVIRDTLVWVCMAVGIVAGAGWAVFIWAAGHFWPSR